MQKCIHLVLHFISPMLYTVAQTTHPLRPPIPSDNTLPPDPPPHHINQPLRPPNPKQYPKPINHLRPPTPSDHPSSQTTHPLRLSHPIRPPIPSDHPPPQITCPLRPHLSEMNFSL